MFCQQQKPFLTLLPTCIFAYLHISIFIIFRQCRHYNNADNHWQQQEWKNSQWCLFRCCCFIHCHSHLHFICMIKTFGKNKLFGQENVVEMIKIFCGQAFSKVFLHPISKVSSVTINIMSSMQSNAVCKLIFDYLALVLISSIILILNMYVLLSHNWLQKQRQSFLIY